MALDSDECSFEGWVQAGVPQGSVLGPMCWNLVYEELLGQETLNNVTRIAYADDLAILVSHRNIKTMEEMAVSEEGFTKHEPSQRS